MGACTGRKVYREKPELEDPVRRKLMGMVEQERESRFYTMEMNERGIGRGGGRWFLSRVRQIRMVFEK